MKLLYSENHIRVAREGDTVRLGISPFALKKLKSVMFINLPEVGERVEIGERFGDVESTKTVSDLLSPVSGEVLSVNEALEDNPDLLYEEPDTWIAEIGLGEMSDGLMEESEYLQFTERL